MLKKIVSFVGETIENEDGTLKTEIDLKENRLFGYQNCIEIDIKANTHGERETLHPFTEVVEMRRLIKSIVVLHKDKEIIRTDDESIFTKGPKIVEKDINYFLPYNLLNQAFTHNYKIVITWYSAKDAEEKMFKGFKYSINKIVYNLETYC